MEKTYTVPQLVPILHVCESTIWKKLIRPGILESVRVGQRKVIVTQSALDRYLAQAVRQ